jgi:hypothetical protein
MNEPVLRVPQVYVFLYKLYVQTMISSTSIQPDAAHLVSGTPSFDRFYYGGRLLAFVRESVASTRSAVILQVITAAWLEQPA